MFLHEIKFVWFIWELYLICLTTYKLLIFAYHYGIYTPASHLTVIGQKLSILLITYSSNFTLHQSFHSGPQPFKILF